MLLSNRRKVQEIVQKVGERVSDRPEISAAALVGSWARQTARPDSDIDFILLVAEPGYFRDDETWLSEIDWKSTGCKLISWRDEDYGAVWSRHIYLTDTTAVELSFGLPIWASVDPLDAGTAKVVGDGFRILYDPQKLMARLLEQVMADATC